MATLHEEPPPSQTTRTAAKLPLWVALLALVVAFLRFGYAFGSGDHDELVPSVLHLLDGTLFTQDWLIQTVTSGVNVRTYFLWLTALPSLVLPPWLVFFVLWVGVFGAVAYGVHALASELVGDRLAAAASVLVACVVAVRWTLGDNALVYNLLAPEGVAWAIALPSIVLVLRRQWVWAGALLGVAAWFHLLVGVHLVLVLGAVGLVRAALTTDLDAEVLRTETIGIVRFGGAFVLAGLPILIPVALQQIGSVLEASETVPAFYIHAQFRNPHHHLFFAFETGRHLRLWPLVVLGMISGVWLARRGALRHGRELATGGTVIAALCAVAVVFVEIIPVEVVAKLQFFKLTVLVSLVASILIAAVLVRALPGRVRDLLDGLLGYRRSGLAATVGLAVVVGALAVSDVGRPGTLLYPLRHTETPLGEVETWARMETNEAALFAIPPSVSSFRTGARRAVVADFTGFVFTDAAMQTWFRRLMDIAPIVPPETGVGIKPVLDEAYHNLNADAWRQLRLSYGTDYVLVQRDERAAPLPFEITFQNEAWTVYRLTDERPTGTSL